MEPNRYFISDSYQTMNEMPANIQLLNTMGLEIQPEYLVVENPCTGCNPIGNPGLVGTEGFVYPCDGRMKDSRGMELTLDRPAVVGFNGNFMRDTYYRSYKNYRNFYSGYKDMNNGQIAYYVDTSISKPFNGSVYTISSTVDKTVFVDPMGSHKPTYIKTPISSTLNSFSEDQSTRDQLSFREDLMSRQQGLYNRTSWVNFNT